jgi:hypothetical protein
MHFFRFLLVTLTYASAYTAYAIGGVNPTGVNVRSNAPNTVFLTFQGLETNERAVEALWCGTVQPGVGAGSVSATDPCVPGTVFGRLPLQFDRARASRGIGQTNLTDIMVIPQSVARRAVQEGIAGSNSDFFYVRRFTGGSRGDQWVVVTCRLGAGGARSPLSLIDVQVRFAGQTEVAPLFPLRSGERLPRFFATIQYNGSGQLKGRWELVRPGDSEPDADDLRTEASLPLEERGLQKRYQLLQPFSQFVPPNGIATIQGPDPVLLDTRVEGPYQVLLRIEATDDREANSAIGGGQVVKSGGVAGFPMPALKYFVGDLASAAIAQSSGRTNTSNPQPLGLMLPLGDSFVDSHRNVTFEWIEAVGAKRYRIEVESGGKTIVASTIQGTRYTPPPTWIATRVQRNARWHVSALDDAGRTIARSEPLGFALRQP